MPDAGGYLTGNPEDFARLLAAFDERNAVAMQHEETMGRLVESVTNLALSVAVLRTELAGRPTEKELVHKRRGTIAVLLLMIFISAGLGDLNTQHCGPGHRALGSINALASGVRDPQVLADAGRPKSSAGCDTLVPLNGHSQSGFPTGWTYLGWLLYSVAGLGVAVWARGPKGHADRWVQKDGSVQGRRVTDT